VHLTLTGHSVTVPPENYGPDLYSYWGPRKMYHEVEVSQGWKQDVHPYPRGSIPERKTRLITKVGDCELFFWMLRLDCMRALVFSSIMLNDKYLIEVSNKKITTGEYFYRIPKSFGKEFDLAKI